MASDYERVLLVKPEVYVYRIPPRSTNRGYRAADWKLDNPDWVSRMKVISRGKECFIRIEDKNSGELFARAPVPVYPGEAVESVLDSSRYFVLRIEDESGRKAFIGIGFQDRGDSFDFNVALQDHFKWLKQSENFEKEAKAAIENPGPKLDLGFKAGQTITINLGNKIEGTSRPRSRPAGGGTGGIVPLLPPPGSKPGGIAAPPSLSQPATGIAAPPSQSQPATGFEQPQQTGSADFPADLGTQNNSNQSAMFDPPPTQQQPNTGDWGDFASASSNQNQQSSDWVQF